MKITTMKFKEITGVVNNKELSLDLFDQRELFQEEPKKRKTMRHGDRTLRKISKSKTNVIEEWPDDTPAPSPIRRKPPPAPKDLIYHLQESLLSYLNCISSQQKKSIRMEIDLLLTITNQSSPRILFQQLQKMQLELNRRVRNRIMHLIFYLIYNQLKVYTQHSVQREIRNYIFCQYYSRKFNFKQLALALCIELQYIYCRVNNYEMSRHYARKALRLAVVIGDQYYQSKMIESLYILNYYQGRLNENTTTTLTKQERRRILQTYSEQQQCPNIFQQSDGSDHLEGKGKEFNLEHHNNYIQNSIPNQNIRYFQNNYHQIIKSIPGKQINVRTIMSKVSSVGTVRKYFGRDNYITLKPQCHIIKPIYQQQVLITHKKESPNQRILGLKRAVKRIRKVLDHTISAYTYHL